VGDGTNRQQSRRADQAARLDLVVSCLDGRRYSTNTCGAGCAAVMFLVSKTRLLCSTIIAAS
jgi:hypothetical protein